MNIFYKIYVNVFWCFRRVHKMMSEDYSKPKPITLHDSNWLAVNAVYSDGTIVDITERVKETTDNTKILTPDYLAMTLGMDNVEGWFYLTETLEYNKIPTEGVLNGL